MNYMAYTKNIVYHLVGSDSSPFAADGKMKLKMLEFNCYQWSRTNKYQPMPDSVLYISLPVEMGVRERLRLFVRSYSSVWPFLEAVAFAVGGLPPPLNGQVEAPSCYKLAGSTQDTF